MHVQTGQLHIGVSYLLVTSITLLFSFSSADGLQILDSGTTLEVPLSLWFGHHCVSHRTLHSSWTDASWRDTLWTT